MEKKLFSNMVVFLVSFVSFFCASCTDQGDEYAVNTVKKSTDVVTGYEYVDQLTHNWDEQTSKLNDYMRASSTRYTVEDGKRVDSVTMYANPVLVASISVEKDRYDITEDQVECSVLSTNILRGESKDTSDGGKAATDSVLVSISDGQLVKVPSTITSYTWADNAAHQFGGLELSSATASVKNVSFSNDTYTTEYTVNLTYKEVNTKNDYTHTSTLKAVAYRHLLKSNEIESVTAENKQRAIIDENTEKCSFDKVIKMTNGTESYTSISIILNREFKGIDAYQKYVNSFDYTLNTVNGVTAGSESQTRTSDNWTVYGKTDKYSANIANGVSADAFSTSYTLYHERAEYKDDSISVSFGYENVSVSESKNIVTSTESDQTGYDKAVYENAIRTLYIGYTQNLSEEVYLYKQARMVVDYGFTNGSLVVNDNNVIATVNFVTIYNDGTQEVEKMSKIFNRSLVCTSNWTSYQSEGFHVYTHLLSVNMAGTEAKKDGYWSWNQEIRNITNVAEFSVSSFENNSWTSTDPNAITVTREGKKYSFGTLSFDATHDENQIALTSGSDELDIYSYSDQLNVTFGSNTTTSVAPGTVKVAKEVKGDFPAEWGKFVSAVATVAPNSSNTDWVYTWSLHFENGTLPVVVEKNSDKATVDQSLFEYDTNSKLNGGVFVKGKLINAIAEDLNTTMLWSDTHGTAKDAMDYATATTWKWNNGKKSVFTSAFKFEVSNNGKSLKVSKEGKEFASYKASTK